MSERTVEKVTTDSYARVTLFDDLHPTTGEGVYIKRNLSNVKPTATPAEVYHTVIAFFSLRDEGRWVEAIDQIDTSDLVVN